MTFIRKRNGFTLGEIVTTTAIIGVLTSIAYPNFMRIKMDTNMELVKQHMRTVAEKMVEVLGKTGAFPDQGNLIEGNETIPEEIDVTANLSGIINKGYTPEYRLLARSNNGNYVLFARPRPGLRGIAGDKCFITDPARPIAETFCWDGAGLDMNVGFNWDFFGPDSVARLLEDPLLANYRAEILAFLLQKTAYYEGFYTDWLRNAGLDPGLPATHLYTASGQTATLEGMFGEAYEILKSKGIEIAVKNQSVSEFLSGAGACTGLNCLGAGWLYDATGNWSEGDANDVLLQSRSDWQVAQVSFALTDSSASWTYGDAHNAYTQPLLESLADLVVQMNDAEKAAFSQLTGYQTSGCGITTDCTRGSGLGSRL